MRTYGPPEGEGSYPASKNLHLPSPGFDHLSGFPVPSQQGVLTLLMHSWFSGQTSQAAWPGLREYVPIKQAFDSGLTVDGHSKPARHFVQNSVAPSDQVPAGHAILSGAP